MTHSLYFCKKSILFLGSCPSGYYLHGNKCFILKYGTEKIKSWVQARADCLFNENSKEIPGGDLAVIPDSATNAFLCNILRRSSATRAFIGLVHSDNRGTWVDHTPYRYTNWNIGEPENLDSKRWTEMLSDGKWNNIHFYTVASRFGYFCQRPVLEGKMRLKFNLKLLSFLRL